MKKLYSKIKKLCTQCVESNHFEKFIMIVILISSGLIGVETYFQHNIITALQMIALIIFTIEVIIRYVASPTTKDYFKNGWNIFDFTIVIICLIPEAWFSSFGGVIALRVLRVFRVLRLLKANEEIRLIVEVFARSLNALFYNMIFFFIFMYLFAIIGVELFQLPNANTIDLTTKEGQYTMQVLEDYIDEAPNAPSVSPDPYENLGETMFTLFRILTGEDWTDIRYNLTVASQKKLIPIPIWIITFYHVLWYIISALLLLNLLVGAILNNYQIIMSEFKQKKINEKKWNIQEKLALKHFKHKKKS